MNTILTNQIHCYICIANKYKIINRWTWKDFICCLFTTHTYTPLRSSVSAVLSSVCSLLFSLYHCENVKSQKTKRLIDAATINYEWFHSNQRIFCVSHPTHCSQTITVSFDTMPNTYANGQNVQRAESGKIKNCPKIFLIILLKNWICIFTWCRKGSNT